MQEHLEVASDGFETRQSMHEAFSFMADGADAGEAKERVHRHGLVDFLSVFEERCQCSALCMMQEAHHCCIVRLPRLKPDTLGPGGGWWVWVSKRTQCRLHTCLQDG